MIFVSTVIQNSNKEILLVRERKPAAYGKLNFPGGHLEVGETITTGAIREAREEVNLEIELEHLIGLYHGNSSVNFVFCAGSFKNQPIAQKSEILDCAWFSIEALRALKDSDVLNPRKLRMILEDFVAGRKYPVEFIREIHG